MGIEEPLVIQSDGGSDFTSAWFQTCCAQVGQWIRCRVNMLSKHEAGWRQQLTLFHVYHNFVLPYASLRLALPELGVISETGAVKRWQARTPAMASGLTDHVWSLREILVYRVPPWPQPQAR